MRRTRVCERGNEWDRDRLATQSDVPRREHGSAWSLKAINKVEIVKEVDHTISVEVGGRVCAGKGGDKIEVVEEIDEVVAIEIPGADGEVEDDGGLANLTIEKSFCTTPDKADTVTTHTRYVVNRSDDIGDATRKEDLLDTSNP